MVKRIYLAGPDVFFPNCREIAADLKNLCQLHGFEGLFPLDNQIEFDDPFEQPSNGIKIYQANIKLIRSCHAVMANLTPFRGPSADAGTVFELGFAIGLGRPVVGYSSSGLLYKYKVQEDGLLIENFGMRDNLMIGASCPIFDTKEVALTYLQALALT